MADMNGEKAKFLESGKEWYALMRAIEDKKGIVEFVTAQRLLFDAFIKTSEDWEATEKVMVQDKYLEEAARRKLDAFKYVTRTKEMALLEENEPEDKNSEVPIRKSKGCEEESLLSLQLRSEREKNYHYRKEVRMFQETLAARDTDGVRSMVKTAFKAALREATLPCRAYAGRRRHDGTRSFGIQFAE